MKEGWWWKLSPWQSFCVKKTYFAKTAVSSLKISELEICLWLTQALNTSMQISRNKGATKKDFRKMAHDKLFFKFLAKGHFLPKNGGTTKTNYKS